MASFQFKPAVREQTPLLIGLIGPSGSGKTYSALRLAAGIQKVRGGNIVGVDTEARRMLHYAEKFRFSYCAFGAPFASERYTQMLAEAAEAANGGVVIVDSMSHEHEGAGGYLELHESQLDKIAGPNADYKRRQQCTFTAWIKPAQDRRRLINALLQLNCGFVFCFRAKEKLLIRKGQEPLQLGWQAIAGDEFTYEMTARCLLPPGCNGVPDWSREAFEHGVPKRMEDHAKILADGAQINEQMGEQLARWSAGGIAAKPDTSKLLSAFSAIGVTPVELEAKIGKPLADWTQGEVDAARHFYAEKTRKAPEHISQQTADDQAAADAQAAVDAVSEQVEAEHSTDAPSAVSESDVAHYAEWYIAIQNASIDAGWSAIEFDAAIKALKLAHPIALEGGKGEAARRMILVAMRAGKLGKDGKITL